MSFYQKFGKRTFDVACAAAALIVFAPFLAIVAVLVRLKLGSPVLFRQVRPGKNAHPFTLLKFRTMTESRDGSGALLPDKDRLTSFGRMLRSTSIDELPELWNVVCGEMSLIGPRPLLIEYLDRYTSEQMSRHNVLPGITGWAQVNGRQDIPFSRRIELDVWYVNHLSLGVDLRIIWMTIWAVARGSGVRSGQCVATVDDLGSAPDEQIKQERK